MLASCVVQINSQEAHTHTHMSVTGVKYKHPHLTSHSAEADNPVP